GTVQHHPARVDHIDSGVHQDGEVRRGGQAGNRDDLGRPQGFTHRADRRDELPRGPFELGSVREENPARRLGGDEVRLARDDGHRLAPRSRTRTDEAMSRLRIMSDYSSVTVFRSMYASSFASKARSSTLRIIAARCKAICSFTYSRRCRMRAKSLLIMRYSIP